MVTIKLKKPARPAGGPERSPDRPPVRGAGAGVRKPRPTLAQAENARAERRTRDENAPPDDRARRDRPPTGPRGDAPPPRARRDDRAPRDHRGPQDDPRARDTRGPRDDRSPPQGNRAFGNDRPRDDRPRDDRPRDDRFARDDRGAPRDNRAFRDAPPARGPRGPWEDRGPRDTRGPGDHRGPRDDRAPRSDRAPRDDRAPRSGDPRAFGNDRPPRDERGGRPGQPPRPAGPAGRNTAFGRDDGPAPRGRARPGARRDDDEDDDDVRPQAPGSLRLSKRMSELGLASRREADEWIPKGWVRVDGKVVTELGSRVMPEQRITIDAKAHHMQAQQVTVLIHKPIGYVSGQAEDGYEPAYVLVTPENQWREDQSGTRFLRTHLRHLAPAGRLDIDSTGLLVLTQDGRVAKQLIGDDSEVEKEYLVRVASRNGEPLPVASLALLNHGLELDGVALRPAQVAWVNDDQLRFVLREGRKRQIRRMCEAVGLDVLGLKRVRIGQVMLGDLPPGQWRYLRADERF